MDVPAGATRGQGGHRAGWDVAHRLLTVQDLADYLDVPVKTIYTWRHHHTGPRGIKVGRHLRFRWLDVEMWLAELAANDGH